MIHLSKKSNLLNVRWRTTVQSKELSHILNDFEDLVKHSRFFRKRLRQKRCKSGFGHSKLSFLRRSHSYDQPVAKKSNLLNVRWRTTAQFKELSPILYDFEDLVKHSRFFRKRLGQKRCKSVFGHSKLSFLCRSHSYDPPVEKKSNLLNVWWQTTVQSKALSLILHAFEDLV